MTDPEPRSKIRTPDFLLIGAMKAGSTTLHDLLAQHEGLYLSRMKEPAFFSREERYGKGLEWYSQYFVEARPDQLCGESSTCYSRFPHYGDVAGRIVQDLPSVKLIYLMRHPVERMYSHYRHRMTERFVDRAGQVLPFEEALRESEEYRDASRYAFQIRQFLQHFPMSRFLFLTFEDMMADSEAITKRVHQFLGVPERSLDRQSVQNRFDDRFDRNATKQAVQRFRRLWPVRVATALIPRSVRPALRNVTSNVMKRAKLGQERAEFSRQLTPMLPETRRALLDEFASANRELEALTGLKVPESWFS